jgi:hypothetical protein
MYRQKQTKIHKIDCKSEINYINIQVSAYNYWCSTDITLDPDNIADENEREMFIMVNGKDELENGDFVQRRNSNDNKNVKFE